MLLTVYSLLVLPLASNQEDGLSFERTRSRWWEEPTCEHTGGIFGAPSAVPVPACLACPKKSQMSLKGRIKASRTLWSSAVIARANSTARTSSGLRLSPLSRALHNI
ncbi:hypothetical protein B0H21DRAFT_746411 [Amylocystis lapponica]|nr:hypothetical protein B0H21DRAFT_746411 [Amylocystis lapponica]